jgi:hypothetical protein
MSESMKPEIEPGVKVKKEIVVKSTDLSTLLVDFLRVYLIVFNINITKC